MWTFLGCILSTPRTSFLQAAAPDFWERCWGGCHVIKSLQIPNWDSSWPILEFFFSGFNLIEVTISIKLTATHSFYSEPLLKNFTMIRADCMTIQKSIQVLICTGPPISRKSVNLSSYTAFTHFFRVSYRFHHVNINNSMCHWRCLSIFAQRSNYIWNCKGNRVEVDVGGESSPKKICAITSANNCKQLQNTKDTRGMQSWYRHLTELRDSITDFMIIMVVLIATMEQHEIKNNFLYWSRPRIPTGNSNSSVP